MSFLTSLVALSLLGAPDVPLGTWERGEGWASLPRTDRSACLSCVGNDGASEQISGANYQGLSQTLFNLIFRLDLYLDAPGQISRPVAPSPALRLSLIAPGSPLVVPRGDWQDAESLSLYRLEIGALDVVASARQQGRGGFWGEMAAGEWLTAQVSAFLIRGPQNATGAYWLGSHMLQLSSSAASAGESRPVGLHGFLSLEDELTRDEQGYHSFSVLPGFGLAMRWKPSKAIAVSAAAGFNAGVWFDVDRGTLPGIAVSLQLLKLEL